MRKFWSKQWILGSILLGLASQSVAMDLQTPSAVLRASGTVVRQGAVYVLSATVTNLGHVPFENVQVLISPGECGGRANIFTRNIGRFDIGGDQEQQISLSWAAGSTYDSVDNVCATFYAASGFVMVGYNFSLVISH